MNLETIAAEMTDISEKLVVSGMVHLMGGNFSVREGDRLAITGHFSAKRALHAEDLFLAGVDDDEPVEGASATLDMHRAIFRKTEAAAIVHAHPYHATLLSYYTDVICPIDENNIYYLGEKVHCIRAAGYMKWDLLAEEMADALTVSPTAILKWHGSFAIGDSLGEAFNSTQAVDQAARFIIDTRRLEPQLGSAEVPGYAKLDSFQQPPAN